MTEDISTDAPDLLYLLIFRYTLTHEDR
jgi:hypothetical protein